MSLTPGQTLSHFRILARIGAGGMGVVYRAEDENLRRQVALKVLLPDFATDEKRRLRFISEARAAAAINHPNIAAVYEIDESGDVIFIAMELIEGSTLRALIAGRPLAITEALRIGASVAQGLAQAHQAKVIHRDLKPENIMVAPDGLVKLLDFGLAKLLKDRGGASPLEMSHAETISEELTVEGKIFGTASYMSPEQARGEVVDIRSDIFSFGIVLYEMVTGRAPFQGKTTMAILTSIIHQQVVPASQSNGEVSPELERILSKCLEKEAADRYQDSRDLVVDIRRLIRDSDSQGMRVIRESGAIAERSRGRRWVLLSVMILLAGLGGAMWMLSRGWFAGKQTGPDPDVSIRQLTSNPAENPVTHVDISPDGKFIAYVDQAGVSIRLIDTGETRSLHLPDGFSVHKVGWFPDGNKLLLIRTPAPGEQAGSLWAISTIDGRLRKIQENVSLINAAVSPDQSHIVFLRGSPATEIWLMGSSGEEPRRIAVAAERDSFGSVAWSPDGQRIAYIKVHLTAQGRVTVIESQDPKSEDATLVLSDQRLGSPLGPSTICWALPDRIIFSFFEPGQGRSTSNLWEIRADSRTGKALGSPRQLTKWVDFMFFNQSVTRDGQRLAFLKYQSQADVYVAEVSADASRLEAARRLTLDDADDWPTAWTPDSRSILFGSGRTGNGDIFKQAIDQQTPEAIISGPGLDIFPTLSPDGAFLLYMARDAATTWALMRAPLSGGPSQEVLTLGFDRQAQCPLLPQGSCVMGEGQGNQLIFSNLSPLEGKGRELARIDLLANSYPAWALSPEGSRVAMSGSDPPNTLRVLGLADGVTRDIPLKQPAKLGRLAWSADGLGLFAEDYRSGTGVLVHVDLEGHVQRLWPPAQQPGLSIFQPVPSPDGRRIAFGVGIDQRNAAIVEHF